MGGIVVAVESRVFSRASSSSPGVDGIVEDAGRRQGCEDRGGMCHSLSQCARGVQVPQEVVVCVCTHVLSLYLLLQLLLDAVVDVHAISEGRGDDFYSLVGSHQFVAKCKSRLNDSKVQG